MNLLTLPSEIRNHIWTLAFGNLTVTPEPGYALKSHECHCCLENHNAEHPDQLLPVIKPFETCKQLRDESGPIFYSTLTLALSSFKMIDRLHEHQPEIFKKVRNLILYIHIDDENRFEWAASTAILLNCAPRLREVTIHNHMRPPMSYEHLVDGLFFAAPLVRLPSRINTTLKFDYTFEDVMFASPYLGEIRCSDALEEHELVIRDLLVDPQFCDAAKVRDLEMMTGILLRIARNHEQPWFAKLQRKRLQELARREEEEAAAEGSAAQGGV
jgi:hypothetical protein